MEAFQRKLQSYHDEIKEDYERAREFYDFIQPIAEFAACIFLDCSYEPPPTPDPLPGAPTISNVPINFQVISSTFFFFFVFSVQFLTTTTTTNRNLHWSRILCQMMCMWHLLAGLLSLISHSMRQISTLISISFRSRLTQFEISSSCWMPFSSLEKSSN